MDVIAWSPNLTAEKAEAAGARLVAGSALVAAPMATRGYRATLWAACGTLYLSLAIVVFLWFAERAAGRESVLWLLAIVWGSDIGAYAAGRIFGGPRLAPSGRPRSHPLRRALRRE